MTDTVDASHLDLIRRVARRMVIAGSDQEAQMLGHQVLTFVEEYEELRSRAWRSSIESRS